MGVSRLTMSATDEVLNERRRAYESSETVLVRENFQAGMLVRPRQVSSMDSTRVPAAERDIGWVLHEPVRCDSDKCKTKSGN
jgi:hypothetical protein